MVLQGSSTRVVQVEKQLGFTNFYMPNEPELVKEAFAGELNGTTKQAQIPSFGEWARHSAVQELAAVAAVTGSASVVNKAQQPCWFWHRHRHALGAHSNVPEWEGQLKSTGCASTARC